MAYNKNNLGGEINVEHGVVDISICLSFMRNGQSDRASPGDVLILLVSSSVSAGCNAPYPPSFPLRLSVHFIFSRFSTVSEQGASFVPSFFLNKAAQSPITTTFGEGEHPSTMSSATNSTTKYRNEGTIWTLPICEETLAVSCGIPAVMVKSPLSTVSIATSWV